MPEQAHTKRTLRSRRSNATASGAAARAQARPVVRDTSGNGNSDLGEKKGVIRRRSFARDKENLPSGLESSVDTRAGNGRREPAETAGVAASAAALTAADKEVVRDSVVTYGRGTKRPRGARAAVVLVAGLRGRSSSPEEKVGHTDRGDIEVDECEEKGNDSGNGEEVEEERDGDESETSEESQESEDGRHDERSLPLRLHNSNAISAWRRRERRFWAAVDDVKLEEDDEGGN
jgi:hypothetical protein